jgi:hypothetical protein
MSLGTLILLTAILALLSVFASAILPADQPAMQDLDCIRDSAHVKYNRRAFESHEGSYLSASVVVNAWLPCVAANTHEYARLDAPWLVIHSRQEVLHLSVEFPSGKDHDAATEYHFNDPRAANGFFL